MATSGSTDFSVSRDDIIKGAMQDLGALALGETPEAAEIEDAATMFNMLVKALHGDGMQLWAKQTATLFLEKNQVAYTLSTSGDHATTSYSSTTVKTDAIATATSIDVTTTSGMTAADYIGIVLDDGTSHWTTIQSVTDSDTVVITSGLPSAATAGNNVYWYTTKIAKPIRIIDAVLRDLNTNTDYPLQQMTRDEYWMIPDKTSTADPTAFYYDPQLSSGILTFDYKPDDVTHTLEFTCHRPFEDFDAAANTPDFPQEWYLALRYNLALRLAPAYQVTGKEFDRIALLADLELTKAKGVFANSPRKVRPTRF